MKKLALILCALSGNALAQTPSAQDIIQRINAQQSAAKDLSFRATGKVNVEGGSQKIDFTLRSIPAQSLARIQFLAPDALADNIMVVDKKEVKQYLFLTNQITVSSIDKAAKDAGISGAANLDFSQMSNTANFLKGYDTQVTSSKKSGSATLYQITASQKNSGDKIQIWVTNDGWRPTQIQMLSRDKVVIELNINNYKLNSGITAASLRNLPKNAQIIRQ